MLHIIITICCGLLCNGIIFVTARSTGSISRTNTIILAVVLSVLGTALILGAPVLLALLLHVCSRP